jgi:hypothetical protein
MVITLTIIQAHEKTHHTKIFSHLEHCICAIESKSNVVKRREGKEIIIAPIQTIKKAAPISSFVTMYKPIEKIRG